MTYSCAYSCEYFCEYSCGHSCVFSCAYSCEYSCEYFCEHSWEDSEVHSLPPLKPPYHSQNGLICIHIYKHQHWQELANRSDECFFVVARHTTPIQKHAQTASLAAHPSPCRLLGIGVVCYKVGVYSMYPGVITEHADLCLPLAGHHIRHCHPASSVQSTGSSFSCEFPTFADACPQVCFVDMDRCGRLAKGRQAAEHKAGDLRSSQTLKLLKNKTDDWHLKQ